MVWEGRMRFEGTVDTVTSIAVVGVARNSSHVITCQKCDPQTFAFVQSTGLWELFVTFI
jgi:hypothetical protein